MPLEFSVDTSPSSFGNHFIVGLEGTELTDRDKRVLGAVRPVGVLLLKRNLDHAAAYPDWIWKLDKLLTGVREYTERDELMVTIDHEGERVNRVPPPLTVFPNGAFFGARAAAVAKAQAIELRSLGVNVSWAPVTDIHSNPANPIIGERAFGRTPDEVINTTVPYLQALMNEGVLGCAKHYPGHGDTSTDSHNVLPVVDLSLEALRKRELRPFKALIEAGVPLVMTAHILYPAIDPTTPATLSKLFITQILRQELGYQHIVVSDDLDMKAIAEKFSDSGMVGHALNVGCDMFIHARYPDGDDKRTIAFAENIARAVAEQKVSEDTLFQSFCRINRVFEDMLSDNKPHALSQDVFAAHAALAREIKASA